MGHPTRFFFVFCRISLIQGGPPDPWESAIGDTTERVVRQGRAVIDYAAKMNAMGINEKSLAGDTNPIADHVASIGRDKMRLLPGGSALTVRKVAVLQGDGAYENALITLVHTNCAGECEL